MTASASAERPVEVDPLIYAGWCPACESEDWVAVTTAGTSSRVVPICRVCGALHANVLFPRGTEAAKPTEIVLDCRGVEVREGSLVVVAGGSARLHERTVKKIERDLKPGWWVNVRMEGGSYTTPDRLAVVG